MNKISKKCRLCKHTLISTGSFCVDRNDIYVLQCSECDLIQLSDFSHIDKSYYSSEKYVTDYIELNKMKDLSAARGREASWNKKRLGLIKSYIPDYNNMNILDYGCGHGGFLEVGWGKFKDLVGYDVSKYYKDDALKNGWKVVNKLDDLKIDPDIIVLFHVLEHLKRPWKLISELIKNFDSLKYIIIEVPNTIEILNSVFKNEAYRKIHYSSDHLYYFTHKTLLNILSKVDVKATIRTGLQRYSIANHFGWLSKNKGGGQNYLNFLNNKKLDDAYEKILVDHDLADSVFIISKLNSSI